MYYKVQFLVSSDTQNSDIQNSWSIRLSLLTVLYTSTKIFFLKPSHPTSFKDYINAEQKRRKESRKNEGINGWLIDVCVAYSAIREAFFTQKLIVYVKTVKKVDMNICVIYPCSWDIGFVFCHFRITRKQHDKLWFVDFLIWRLIRPRSQINDKTSTNLSWNARWSFWTSSVRLTT